MTTAPDTIDARAGHASIEIAREPHLAERVLCVGGQPGNGKTMMTPIVGSLARVEIQKFNYAIEHVCELSLLGKLEPDAATAMVRMLTDLDLYNMGMGRETNFRPSDLSSVFKNPGGWRYVRRIFQAGDEAVIERIRRERPILHLTIHRALAISRVMFAALGDRLRIIELVRHPLYMLKQQFLYSTRYGTDVRDFAIWFRHRGRSLPFFARGWEEEYLRLNPMDQTIHTIDRLARQGEEVYHSLTPSQKQQVLIVPFERFVLDPWPFLRQIEALIETRVTARTRRELKRQRVPRTRIAAGIPLPIYKLCGWEPPERGATERQELQKRRRLAAEHASPEGLKLLDRLSEAYEARFLQGIV